eukprot:993074-Amphidinium_carterae.1
MQTCKRRRKNPFPGWRTAAGKQRQQGWRSFGGADDAQANPRSGPDRSVGINSGNNPFKEKAGIAIEAKLLPDNAKLENLPFEKMPVPKADVARVQAASANSIDALLTCATKQARPGSTKPSMLAIFVFAAGKMWRTFIILSQWV